MHHARVIAKNETDHFKISGVDGERQRVSSDVGLQRERRVERQLRVQPAQAQPSHNPAAARGQHALPQVAHLRSTTLFVLPTERTESTKERKESAHDEVLGDVPRHVEARHAQRQRELVGEPQLVLAQRQLARRRHHAAQSQVSARRARSGGRGGGRGRRLPDVGGAEARGTRQQAHGVVQRGAAQPQPAAAPAARRRARARRAAQRALQRLAQLAVCDNASDLPLATPPGAPAPAPGGLPPSLLTVQREARGGRQLLVGLDERPRDDQLRALRLGACRQRKVSGAGGGEPREARRRGLRTVGVRRGRGGRGGREGVGQRRGARRAARRPHAALRARALPAAVAHRDLPLPTAGVISGLDASPPRLATSRGAYRVRGVVGAAGRQAQLQRLRVVAGGRGAHLHRQQQRPAAPLGLRHVQLNSATNRRPVVSRSLPRNETESGDLAPT